MYNVISPDGFPLNSEPLISEEQAQKSIDSIIERYKFQGFYSTVQNGERVRIPVSELKEHLKIMPHDA